MRGGDPVGEQRGQAVLRAILAFAIVSTALHYSHNATIFTDGLAGLAIVAFTAWSALGRSGPYRSRRANPTRAARTSSAR